jgi:hypothetical protein
MNVVVVLFNAALGWITLRFDLLTKTSNSATLFIEGIGNMKKLILSGLMLLASSGLVNADIITQWNFNSITPGDVSTATPSTGSGSLSLVGGVTHPSTGSTGAGSSDLATTNLAFQTSTYAAQGTGNLTRGVQFNIDTTGWSDITVSWDQRLSNTAANTWRFQYSLDGSTFVNSTQFTFTPAATGTGDVWYNGRSVDLSSIAGVANNANFAFRIVAEFDPNAGNYLAARSTSSYATSGTSRFDMVSVSGITAVPEPASMVLLGVAGIGGLAFRQFRRKTNSSESVAS